MAAKGGKKPLTATMSEYEYVLSIGDKLGEYVDEWIAVVDNQIVARGKSAKEVYEKAKKYDSSKMPFIMRVPTSKVMVL
jgi:peptidyl-tRNA hydrolase